MTTVRSSASVFFTILCALLFSAMVSAAPRFQDKGKEYGIAPGGSTAAWGDANGDGWLDLCTGGRIRLNQQGKKFTHGQSLGAGIFGDFNNNGRLDLFCWKTHTLFENSGNGAFTKVDFPQLPARATQAASWGDFDGDGFIDLYVGGYEKWPMPSYPDVRLRNYRDAATGKRRFKISWQQSAKDIQGFKGRARSIACCDFDEDGDLDIYVSNYRQRANLLWRNNGKGAFTEEAAELGIAGDPKYKHGYGHTIGSAWGDFDNDGRMDLFVGNFNHHDQGRISEEVKFHRNTGPDNNWKFEDKSQQAKIAWQESYATPALGDYDNDGDLDLFLTTVYAVGSWSIRNYPVLYRNDGNWRFTDVTEEEGLGKLGPTYQAAWADFDRDGDLDLVSSGKLLVNTHATHHWIEIELTGDGKTVNRSAIGAQVRIKLKDRILLRQVEGATGTGNQNAPVLHFGLGGRTESVRAEILWPSGERQRTKPLSVDRLHTIKQAGD